MPTLSHSQGPLDTSGYPLLNIINKGIKKVVLYLDPSKYENAESFNEAVEEFDNWWTLTPAAQQL